MGEECLCGVEFFSNIWAWWGWGEGKFWCVKYNLIEGIKLDNILWQALSNGTLCRYNFSCGYDTPWYLLYLRWSATKQGFFHCLLSVVYISTLQKWYCTIQMPCSSLYGSAPNSPDSDIIWLQVCWLSQYLIPFLLCFPWVPLSSLIFGSYHITP